jgi:hypothetical protein
LLLFTDIVFKWSPHVHRVLVQLRNNPKVLFFHRSTDFHLAAVFARHPEDLISWDTLPDRPFDILV